MTITVILTCGHEKDYTGWDDRLPNVGDEHSCWSSCDYVPTRNPHVRYVREIRRAPQSDADMGRAARVAEEG